MTPFKEHIDAAAVRAQAASLQSVWPAFDRDRFERTALDGLDALELKDRVRHVARALHAHLPPAWEEATALLVAALPPEPTARDGVSSHFAWWPFLQVIEDHGAQDPAHSLTTLRAMTPVFTAEFAIRPLLLEHTDLSLRTLLAWTTSDNHHVRRLVSEGSRPRLPWGLRLTPFIDDPTRTLPLLEALRDDPSEYVRRSVANHLNDIAKDHPQVVVDIARRWLDDAPAPRAKLVRHALRTLIKQGHPDALALLGFPPPQLDRVALRLAPATLTLGGALTIELSARSLADQSLVIDLQLDRPTARGRGSKVFKGTTREATRGEALELQLSLPLRPVTVRRYYAGEHGLTVLVNGEAVASATFDLVLPD